MHLDSAPRTQPSCGWSCRKAHMAGTRHLSTHCTLPTPNLTRLGSAHHISNMTCFKRSGSAMDPQCHARFSSWGERFPLFSARGFRSPALVPRQAHKVFPRPLSNDFVFVRARRAVPCAAESGTLGEGFGLWGRKEQECACTSSLLKCKKCTFGTWADASSVISGPGSTIPLCEKVCTETYVLP